MKPVVKNFSIRDHTFMISKKNVQFLHPPSPLFLSVRMGPNWARPSHPTPRRQNLDLEHCLDSNNTYTSYSCGHSISVDTLPLPPCNHPLPSEFSSFFTWPPIPPSTGRHKCMVPKVRWRYNTKKLCNFISFVVP